MAEIYNNPGNIQIGQGFAGTVGEYASDRKGGGKQPYVEFDSPQMGLRAIYKDLRSKVNTFDGDVAKIISKYAPNNENKTQAYIDNVIKQIGSDTITADNIDEAVRAIVRHENGTNSETTKYYLDDPKLLKEAKELAQYDMPATMTYKKAAETYLPQKRVFTEEEVKVADTSNNFAEQYMRGAENEIESLYGKRPEEVIKETETVIKETPNFYANQNITDIPRDGTYTLPPDQIITPLIRETIEEDVTVQPQTINMPERMPYQRSENERMQEAARRSMMQGNEEERMADYENALFQSGLGGMAGNPYYPARIVEPTPPPMQAAQRMMGGYAQGGTVNQAQGLASLGRGGDSTLVHMQPQEVAGLQQLAQSNGTSLTRNPMTGYPEAFSLGGMFKAGLPIAAGFATGGAGFGLGAQIAAGAATGATVAKVSGDDVLAGTVSGGMGGISGGGLNTALMGPSTATGMAGTSSIANPLAGATPIQGAATGTAMPGYSFGQTQTPTVGVSGLETGGGALADGTIPQTDVVKQIPSGGSGSIGMPRQGAVDFSGSFNQGIDQVYRNLGTVDPTTGLIKDASTMEVAKTLGSPVASLGLGGLEESDFINTPDFDDPRDRYNPYSKLNLSNNTGISAAMNRDTGLRLLARGGYLQGPGDGMSDDIPATINGDEPAALADGEFVVPADVVSHLGNGSSEAGSKQLYAMMDRIRKARTGRQSQGKEIKPGKYMPR